jgi:hypothetical protein
MANMRGLFGRRGSYLPATLNILQNIGWATVEIVVIATAAAAVTTEVAQAAVHRAGRAVRDHDGGAPLGSVTPRKYAVWVVIAASVYLYWQVLRQPLVGTEDGSWSGFWLSVDVVIAIVISFAPLAGDYSRHSRSGRAAFAGAALGYGAAAVAFVGLGLFAFFAIHDFAVDPTGALLALPAGAVALVILLVDEVDEAFANIYSTTMSTQNMLARIDRRLLAVVIGALATGLAFVVGVVQSRIESALLVAALALVFIGAMFVVIRPALSRLSVSAGEGGPAQASSRSPSYRCAPLLITNAIGVHPIFGAFLLGAVIPHERLAPLVEARSARSVPFSLPRALPSQACGRSAWCPASPNGRSVR